MEPTEAAGPLLLETVDPFDLDSLVAASLALYRDEGAEPPPALALRIRLHRRLRDDAAAVLFRLAPDSDPIAFALHSRCSALARIEQFRVEPARRRAGLGRRCVQALLEGPLASAERIEVRVLEDNAVAIAFWRRLGFGRGRLVLDLHRRS